MDVGSESLTKLFEEQGARQNSGCLWFPLEAAGLESGTSFG